MSYNNAESDDEAEQELKELYNGLVDNLFGEGKIRHYDLIEPLKSIASRLIDAGVLNEKTRNPKIKAAGLLWGYGNVHLGRRDISPQILAGIIELASDQGTPITKAFDKLMKDSDLKLEELAEKEQ